MRFKGKVRDWDSGPRFETDKEFTACKKSKNIRPADNMGVESEKRMVG